MKRKISYGKRDDRMLFIVVQEGFNITTPTVIYYDSMHLEITYGLTVPNNSYNNGESVIISKKEFDALVADVKKRTGMPFKVVTTPFKFEPAAKEKS